MASNDQSAPSSTAPRSDDPERIQQFGARLKEVGYPGQDAREVFGRDPFGTHPRLELFRRRHREVSPLNTFIKLFCLQEPVAEKEARSAFEPLSVDWAAEAGLVERRQDLVSALLNISPCQSLICAHDPSRRTAEGDLAADHVLGVTPPALALAKLTNRSHSRLTLDLGTGCGVHALLAAKHSDRVIATDINPRALAFTRLNAALNGIANVECRQGSLFAPVEGLQFDLALSNPPFVISPAPTYLFRDTGHVTDGFSRELLQSLPQYLTEGGFAAVMCNWAHYGEEDWSAPLERWLGQCGADCWFLHGGREDPLGYADLCNRHLKSAAYSAVLDKWRGFFAELGIQSVSLGAVIMRRRTAPKNWIRTEAMPSDLEGIGHALERLFAAQDCLAEHEKEDLLLEQIFRVENNHWIHQTLKPGQAGYCLEQMELELDGRPGYRARLDGYAFQLLCRCDGTRRLGDILGELAQLARAEPEAFTRRGAEIARQLIAQAVLVPCAGGA